MEPQAESIISSHNSFRWWGFESRFKTKIKHQLVSCTGSASKNRLRWLRKNRETTMEKQNDHLPGGNRVRLSVNILPPDPSPPWSESPRTKNNRQSSNPHPSPPIFTSNLPQSLLGLVSCSAFSRLIIRLKLRGVDAFGGHVSLWRINKQKLRGKTSSSTLCFRERETVTSLWCQSDAGTSLHCFLFFSLWTSNTEQDEQNIVSPELRR